MAKTWQYCATCGQQFRSEMRASLAANPEVAFCPVDGSQLDDNRKCPDPECKYHNKPVPRT
jgi:hypothetical protein